MAFVQDRVQKHPIEHEVVDNSILTAFQEAKSAVEGHVSYTNKVVSYHRSFPKFCELPAEIREMRHSSPVKPSPSLKLADSRRAGSRTLVSRQMNEEVLNLMLQRTERFILPRNFGDSDANNATWFHKFLAIVPGARGLNAVKYLDFPDMYLLKCVPRARALNNPSIDLAVACTNLRKLEMGFSAEKLTVLVYMYKLPSGDGILEYPEVLQDLGKWTMKRFLVQRYPEKGIQVELASGCSIWKKPNCGLMITLDADDMKQVEKRIELRKACASVSALDRSSLII
ncbi:uncharacterized protein SETTUDRAFT_20206 [Exserohilum turcica Et28A]|uniref:Uncharacterized protein n=1 Tax=Exserohilum turcicum (strain 28A) TaxID=671987 RepID=R0IIC7_EXST2|nr:uncharacterized protein SETTUDRAFT_20206 [Exserohilum turcica Et28A]EOA84676.1 hypothetical protein SETTUDRAFT_20206 [Exserohilum turcica Et28A]